MKRKFKKRISNIIVVVLIFGLSIFFIWNHYYSPKEKMNHHQMSVTMNQNRNQSQYILEYSEIMEVMHHDMSNVPISGNDNVDFLKEMIPHHQGAVDMAVSILKNSKDKRVRNLALGILTEQQNEIKIMNKIIEELKLENNEKK